MKVGFTGHQDLPAGAPAYVRERLERFAGEVATPLEGICSLAAGADQLFAEVVFTAGGALHVIVPSAAYESSFASEEARIRYRDLLERAHFVETLAFAVPGSTAYMAAGRRIVDLCDHLVAVWDGQPARGPGGTADIVVYARSLSRPMTIVWPPGTTR
jgi:hypothetical protein